MKRCTQRLIASCVAALAMTLTAASAHAGTIAPATQPAGDYREFNLNAVAPPVPAMKYRLGIDLADSIDGNAAPLYLQSVLVSRPADQSTALDQMFNEESDDDEELAKLAAQRVPWLDTSVPMLLIDANRRTRCDWDPPMRERTMETLLPHLNRLREMANLLALKGRIAVVHGDVGAAIDLIRASIIMADRADDGGETFMVNELVSVGMYALANHRLTRVMNMPNCPNLYWAIRELPAEFGNQVVAARTERAQIFMVTPGFKQARERELSADEWQTLIAQLREHLASVMRRWPGSEFGGPDELAARLTNTAVIEANDRGALPVAREHYKKTRQLDEAAVDKIEPAKLVAVWYFESCMAVNDEVVTAFSLPYPQRLAKIQSLREPFAMLRVEQPSNPCFILADPTYRFVVTNARVDRMTAALCAVEAIRAYAAAHDKALPPTLDAIGDETPAPVNPITGKPFGYRVEGDVAYLSDDGATIGKSDNPASYPLEYTVKIRK